MGSVPKGPHLVHQQPHDDDRKAREIGSRDLVNRLNYLHFQNGAVLLRLCHLRHQQQILLAARPQPCAGNRVECLWADPAALPHPLEAYQLIQILVGDGRQLIALTPEASSLDETGASFRLPATGRDINARRIRRYPGTGIRVQLTQNGATFSGSLADFTPVSLRVEVTANAPLTLDWLDPEAPVNLTLSDSQVNLFSGDCRLLRQTGTAAAASLVFQPLHDRLRRFRPREFRSLRRRLLPAPDIVFHHPLTGKLCQLQVLDLSGSGFAVEEDEQNCVLLPGLIIPDIDLSFAAGCRIRCRAQVVYRTPAGPERDGRVRCGLAVLDMEPHHQVRLLGLLQQADDRNAYLCSQVDLDELWEFFFATGFVYPEKYRSLQAGRERFRETYGKLYTQNLDIARHFVYRESGSIHGHIAMLRLYENSWMIHHHAASHSGSRKAGLQVLGQISRYVNELHRLRGARLGYVFCYYRPENRFPSRVFGGAARHIDDPKGCSVAPFAYLHPRRATEAAWELPAPWQLGESRDEDLRELHHTLEQQGAGLIIPAFDLEPGMTDGAELSREYARIGLRRDRLLYSLKKNGALKAVILVHLASAGLNLSALTNSIQCFVLDPDGLPGEVLQGAIAQFRIMFDEEEPSVLVYPAAYAEEHAIGHDKLYHLWILNLQHLDGYFSFCNRFLRNI